MIYPAEKKEKERYNNNFSADKKSENSPILHAVYKKVPMTLEKRRRQYEEQMRAKYAIKKEKTGGFI